MGNSGWGCLAVRVFQENAGSLPRAKGSLCRNGCGLAYLRCGRSFRTVALCLAKIEPFYWGNWRSREREMGRERNGNGNGKFASLLLLYIVLWKRYLCP